MRQSQNSSPKGEVRATVLDAIGRTRIISLRHMVPEKSARILVKLEYENPTGSMKDRMALAMVEAPFVPGSIGLWSLRGYPETPGRKALRPS